MLGDAMDAATHRKQLSPLDHQNVPTRIDVAQDFSSPVIANVVKAWTHDGAVADIVIDVAVVDPIPVVSQRCRRGERYDFKSRIGQRGAEFGPKHMIRMTGILLLVQENTPVRREAGDDINMTFGAVEKVISPQSPW